MRLALLFSGQGGQQPEHLARLRAEAAPDVAAALAATIPNLWRCVAPDPAVLSQNRQAQPFIFAYQMTLWHLLRPFLPRPIGGAGYSLGEMAACCAAGAFSVNEGIVLCAERARLMDEAFGQPAGLLAILGLDGNRATLLAERCGLFLAIRNGPHHFVLGGPRDALPEAEAMARSLGASRTVPLAVATPSHTPLLASASAGFREILAQRAVARRLDFPVLSAIDGRAAREQSTALEALARQISTPLDWAGCLGTLLELQPDHILETGPGNSLARMVEDIAPGLPVRSVDDFRSLAGIQDWLGDAPSCAQGHQK